MFVAGTFENVFVHGSKVVCTQAMWIRQFHWARQLKKILNQIATASRLAIWGDRKSLMKLQCWAKSLDPHHMWIQAWKAHLH